MRRYQLNFSRFWGKLFCLFGDTPCAQRRSINSVVYKNGAILGYSCALPPRARVPSGGLPPLPLASPKVSR